MSFAQNKINEEIIYCLKKIKIFDYIPNYKITKSLIRMVLLEIVPRKNRVTVVDYFEFNEQNVDKVLDYFENNISKFYV